MRPANFSSLQGLLNCFLRALNCGAITEEEALATGLTLEELRGRSFVKIMHGRREPGESTHTDRTTVGREAFLLR